MSMSVLRSAIDSAVAAAIADHPKFFTPKGAEKARAVIVRKVMAALRDDDGSDADRSDSIPPATPYRLADPQSREARGYINLRRMAGAVAATAVNDGRIVIMEQAYRECVFALADIPPINEWLFLTETPKITAWLEFFSEMLPHTARRVILETRDGQSGILVPDYWPPSKTGQRYNTPEAA